MPELHSDLGEAKKVLRNAGNYGWWGRGWVGWGKELCSPGKRRWFNRFSGFLVTHTSL